MSLWLSARFLWHPNDDNLPKLKLYQALSKLLGYKRYLVTNANHDIILQVVIIVYRPPLLPYGYLSEVNIN